MYSIEALERGIADIEKNIEVLKGAIAKERARIDEYYGMIDVLKEKQRAAALKEKLEEGLNADPGQLL